MILVRPCRRPQILRRRWLVLPPQRRCLVRCRVEGCPVGDDAPEMTPQREVQQHIDAVVADMKLGKTTRAQRDKVREGLHDAAVVDLARGRERVWPS